MDPEAMGKNIGFNPQIQIRVSIDNAAPNRFHCELRMRLNGAWLRSAGYGATRDDAFESAMPALAVRTGYPPTLLRTLYGIPPLDEQE